MNKASLILLLIIIVSCSRSKDKIHVIEDVDLTEAQIDSVLDEYNFEYSKMVFIDSLEKAIIPIKTQHSRRGKRYSEKTYYADSYPNFWNFIFYDLISGETRLLSDKKMRISSFETNLRHVGPILSKSVLYNIGDTDYDLDNKLTYTDPEQLFISDIDGLNFKRLSPINEKLNQYELVPNTDKIIFQTIRDTNSDKEFDPTDERIWYLIDLTNNSKPTEILRAEDRNKIERLYFNQWLVEDNSNEE